MTLSVFQNESNNNLKKNSADLSHKCVNVTCISYRTAVFTSVTVNRDNDQLIRLKTAVKKPCVPRLGPVRITFS